jgi:serine/threonine-protein kinase PpkA
MHVTQPVPELPSEHAWLQPLVTGLMAKQPAERYNTGASFVEALHKLLKEAPESVNLHQSQARKGGGNRISGSSATQQRTRVNLSQTAEARPAWFWPAIGGGVLALAIGGWIIFKPGAPPLDSGPATTTTLPPGEAPPVSDPGVATNSGGEPLAVQFGSANAGEAPVALGAQELEDLLTRADIYLKEGTSKENAGRHLDFPADDSALGLYRQVLASDPENARALAGVEGVLAYYRRISYELCEQGKWAQCGFVARKGLDVVDAADHTLLKLRAASEAGERGESPVLPELP